MEPDMETHSDNETNERKEMPTWRSLSFVCFENEIDSSEAPSQKSISSAKNIGKIEIIRNRYEAIPITWFKTNPCLSASLPLCLSASLLLLPIERSNPFKYSILEKQNRKRKKIWFRFFWSDDSGMIIDTAAPVSFSSDCQWQSFNFQFSEGFQVETTVFTATMAALLTMSTNGGGTNAPVNQNPVNRWRRGRRP